MTLPTSSLTRVGFAALAGLLLSAPLPAQSRSIGGGPPAGGKTVQTRGTFEYVALHVPSHVPRLRVVLTEIAGDDADLYVRRGAPPTLTEFDFASRTPGTSNEELVVDATTVPALATDLWHIGVLRPNGTLYDIQGFLEVVPAHRPGLGALPWEADGQNGTTFRVWAPNATEVHVASDFNGWASNLARLADEGNGTWSHLGPAIRIARQPALATVGAARGR